jgi:hypothetical protein
MRNRAFLLVIVLSLLLGLSSLSLSAEPSIQRGIDVFSTPGNGKTFHDFSLDPIPAGFFCKNSKAFTGKVTFKGLPLATNSPGQLKGIDTIVERLDDAVFNDKGIATTRIRLRALSLVSITPIRTACGAFHVYLSLNGSQRLTTMTILRTQENGGDFLAPLAVDVKMTFIPVKPVRAQGSTRKLELTGSVNFPVTSVPWSLARGALKRTAAVSVDTNGDLASDTLLPGTSNFMAGQTPDRSMSNTAQCSCCPGEYCHSDYGDQHCTILPQCPGVPSCC